MILPDHEIRRLCQQHAMVNPFDPNHLNPASLDLTLGDRIMFEVPESPELQIHGIAGHTKDDPYWLQPGEFVLAETRQIFAMPDHVCGFFYLKSSRAREGYEHLHAGFADCGWYGSRLTLELKNARKMHPLPLYPNMRIGQMVFFTVSGVPERSYAEVGRYNADLAVTASKG